MPISATTHLVPLASIWIDQEQRQRQGELKTKDLEASIARNGLINPLIVERGIWPGALPHKLVAGERRLKAAATLAMVEVKVCFAEDLSPVDLQIIELEENIKRQDLEWQDMVRAVGRIHKLYLERDADWTMGETAAECGMSLGNVSMYLSVGAKLAEPRIAEATSIREAYNIIGRQEQRKAGEALEELVGAPAPATPAPQIEARAGTSPEGKDVFHQVNVKTGERREITAAEYHQIVTKPVLPLAPFSGILQESFPIWASTYTGPKFNFIHCDFPYGVGLFDGPQGRGAEPSPGYADTAQTYWDLIDALCSNLDRVMTLSGHLMFWLSADQAIINATVARFAQQASSLAFHKFPMIWVKSDNAGIASDPTHGPRHTYEACLFASRAKRQIVQIKADTYSCPTDKRLHPSTKPQSMLEHFMEMIVDENTTMLDPTCGSGAALRAAEALGARHTLGLEIDPDFAQAAQAELRRFRALRNASARVAK